MVTEENIVYQLLDELRGGLINNDEPLSERHIRSFLKEHRGAVIRKSFNDGMTLVGPEFQRLGKLTLTLDLTNGYNVAMPSIIQLPYFSGIRITSASGNVIPVMSPSAFRLQKKNVINGYLPKACLTDGLLLVHEGKSLTSAINAGSDLTAFQSEITANKEIYVEAVLSDPDDASSYDWTSSPYPLSEELLPALKGLVWERNLSKILNTKSDEVANMKNDVIRYHDQGKVD